MKILIFNIMKYLISYGKVNKIQYTQYKTWQQKFLWFLNFYYTKQNKEQLFDEVFYSFNFGPVNMTLLDSQYSFEDEDTFFYDSYIDYKEKRKDVLKIVENKYYMKNNEEIKNKFIEEFNDKDERKWKLFEEIFKLCKDKSPSLLVVLSHKQELWRNKSSLSQEEKRILLEDILNEKTDPLNYFSKNLNI